MLLASFLHCQVNTEDNIVHFFLFNAPVSIAQAKYLITWSRFQSDSQAKFLRPEFIFRHFTCIQDVSSQQSELAFDVLQSSKQYNPQLQPTEAAISRSYLE